MKPNLKSQKEHKAQSDVDALREFMEEHICAVDYIICLLKDIKNNLPPGLYRDAELNLDIKTVKTRFACEGLKFATLTLPMLSAGLFGFLENGHVSYPSFKLLKDTVHPVFLQGLFRLACSEGEYQGEAIKYIYQISVMFKKLKGPYLDSVLVKQLDDFVAVDEELRDIDFTDELRLPIMQQVRAEIYQLFLGFNLDLKKVKPRPGPGATNKPVAKHMRYRPHTLYTQIEKVLPYVDWFMVNPYDLVHQTKLFRDVYINPVESQRARLKYVFKTFGKARGICIEENEPQFLQQAVKAGLYDWIENSPITLGRIDFKDQSINANLALKASEDLEDATIDCSEASDRVAREAISWSFQDTEIHDVLMALSTKWIDFPKELSGKRSAIKCAKYAPMGSGLCFPIETVWHWALIRALIVLSQYPDEYKERVYVYGDDIIVPSEIAEMVYTYFPLFGMKINVEKSYYKSHFRESCGIHAYNGKNITPVFIKNLPIKSSLTVIMSCIEVEAQFKRLGYDHVARHFEVNIRQAMSGYDMPYVPQGSSVLGFIRDDISMPAFPGSVRRRFDSFGNSVQRVRSVVPKLERNAPLTEFESYLRHVLTSDNDKEVSGNPLDFELKWKWAPCPELFSVLNPPNWLKLLRNNRDSRTQRDIQQEAIYEKSIVGNQRAKRGYHERSNGNVFRVIRTSSRYVNNGQTYMETHGRTPFARLSWFRCSSDDRDRQNLCRSCVQRKACRLLPLFRGHRYCEILTDWKVCAG